MPGNPFVDGKSYLFEPFTGFGIIKCRHLEEEFFFLFIQKDNHCAFDTQQLFYSLDDKLQKFIEAPVSGKCFGDPEKCVIGSFSKLCLRNVS